MSTKFTKLAMLPFALSLTACATMYEDDHQKDLNTMRAYLAQGDLESAINYYGNTASFGEGHSKEKIDLLCGYIEDNGLTGQYPGLGC